MPIGGPSWVPKFKENDIKEIFAQKYGFRIVHGLFPANYDLADISVVLDVFDF